MRLLPGTRSRVAISSAGAAGPAAPAGRLSLTLAARFDLAQLAELLDVLQAVWTKRRDRYSEERLVALLSPTGYDPKEHRKIEMISLGG